MAQLVKASVVGLSSAGGESWQLVELSQDRVTREFLSLAMHFNRLRRLIGYPALGKLVLWTIVP